MTYEGLQPDKNKNGIPLRIPRNRRENYLNICKKNENIFLI